jgi:hypothetical protein
MNRIQLRLLQAWAVACALARGADELALLQQWRLRAWLARRYTHLRRQL